jgi:hypothetical protein
MGTQKPAEHANQRARERGGRFDRYLKIFQAVTKAYVETKQSSPVCAHVIDPDATERSQRLTVDGIHYLVDVERATALALTDAPELQPIWFRLAAEKPVEPKLAKEVITRCARIYQSHSLQPWLYFRPFRLGSPHRRVA